MIRLFGHVRKGGADGAALRRLQAAFDRESESRSLLWERDHIGLGFDYPPTEDPGAFLLADEADEKLAFQCGYFLNPESDAGTAQRGLSLLRGWDHRQLARLNGLFTLGEWEPQTRTLTLASDRYGMRPLYYAQSADALFFSSELGTLLRAGAILAKPNWLAWNLFLRLDHLPGDLTFFQGVRRMPPASVLTFNLDRGLRIESYWSPSDIRLDPSISQQEAIEGAQHHFQAAIRRISAVPGQGKTWIPLSGGHDSRWIAAELSRQEIPCVAFTTRKLNACRDDIELARAVARALGTRHRVIDLPRDFLQRYETLKNRLMDYESDENFYLCPMAASVPAEYSVCIEGTGDLVINGIFFSEQQATALARGQLRAVARQLLRKRGLGRLGNFANSIPKLPEMRREFSEAMAVDYLVEQLKAVQGFADPLTWYHLFGRVRRELSLASSHLFGRRSQVFSPYLDNDFFCFLMSVPPHLKADRALLHRVLQQFYPEVASIPFTHFLSERDKVAYTCGTAQRDWEDQLRLVNHQLHGMLGSARRTWLSNSFYLFLVSLLGSDQRLGIVHPLVNRLVPAQVRKYPFGRNFTSFSMLRMIGMLEHWMDEYGIQPE
jgi:hypothetical protein